VDIREKAASISTALNVTLTVAKFVLYGATGSLAILAEAWHSFSDIATSALTYLAVRRTVRQERAQAAKETAPDSGGEEHTPPDQTDATVDEDPESEAPRPIPSAEQVASLIISTIILIAGLTVVSKVVWYEPVTITRPLLAGVLFLVFAVGSYLVHRLEIDVGHQTGSSGLVADGMHARADMIASLLTGASLILYHLGLPLDRFIAGVIAVLVLSVALETMVNLGVGYYRGETRYVPRYRTHEILAKVLSFGWLVRAASEFAGRPGFVGLTSAFLYRVRRWSTAVVVIATVVAYGRTCFFSVGLTQEGVVEHLGRPTRRAAQPGLHMKWPWPIDRVILVDKTTVWSSRIGNKTDPEAFALIWTREHGTEVPFLSGDNNFFYPYLVVHWRVKDTFDVVYRQQGFEGARRLLDGVGHQVMSQLCTRREFYDLASTYRKPLAEDVRAATQARLDELASGIEIVSVNMSDIHPPVFIADAFEEVVIARYQETRQMVNEALGYQNERLSEAAGQAAKMEFGARAYLAEKVKRATGRAGRFALRCEALSDGRQITFDRVHFDHIVASLRDVPKVLIDPEAGSPDLWMGFKGPMGSSLTPDQAKKVEELKRKLE